MTDFESVYFARVTDGEHLEQSENREAQNAAIKR